MAGVQMHQIRKKLHGTTQLRYSTIAGEGCGKSAGWAGSRGTVIEEEVVKKSLKRSNRGGRTEFRREGFGGKSRKKSRENGGPGERPGDERER